MSLFPMFVKLHGRPVTVVGGGIVAEGKIPSLLEAGAHVRVIAPQITRRIADWVRTEKVDWWAREFASGDLKNTYIVVAATSAPGVNAAVFREADERGILCNAVDDIENCHFYYGALAQRGDLQIAVSTNGKSPALAQRIRKELEQTYGEEYAFWIECLGAAREMLRKNASDTEQSKAILHHMASQEMFEHFVRGTKQQDC
jgi:precorrin-2 dehydrogenase / sirohydrochlorin ferrochelatase